MLPEEPSLLERVKNFIFTRQRDYLVTFDKKNLAAQAVLKDLSVFCKANDSSFHPDQRVNAIYEGRREVWLRIQKHLNLSTEDLWEIYNKKRG